MNKLIGCDLEYAVETPNGFFPAGILPIRGRKGHPEPMETGGVEIDCCAVELTMPPASTEDMFVNTILTHLEAVRQRYNRVKLVTKSSIVFDKAILKQTRYANTMGCDPDYNAWTGKENPRPRTRTGLRTFGGHIHIEGGDTDTIKACDLTLGMWSVLEDRDTDRRKLYGKAGAHRVKPYGVEYRVLSNFWCDKEELIRSAYRLTQYAREIAPRVDMMVSALGGPNAIQDVINSSNVDRAKTILKSVGV